MLTSNVAEMLVGRLVLKVCRITVVCSRNEARSRVSRKELVTTGISEYYSYQRDVLGSSHSVTVSEANEAPAALDRSDPVTELLLSNVLWHSELTVECLMVVSVTPRHTAVSYSNQGGKQAIGPIRMSLWVLTAWQGIGRIWQKQPSNRDQETLQGESIMIIHDILARVFLLCSQAIQSDPHPYSNAVMMTFAAVEWTCACLLVLSRALPLSVSHSSNARSTTSLLTVTTMTVARWPLRPNWPLTTGHCLSVPQQTCIGRNIVKGVKKQKFIWINLNCG